ncbi:hypothetical protein DPMN_011569 [Dreissena polymorpha]|uniref:Uncharacterized protein n=1 Tax=Dreissena polymorpha TaxID=45954 RepID=A0A9D4S2M3_DREPO|nr:hypothetical protein DPMN_011569 [Dreissena polymorpha]
MWTDGRRTKTNPKTTPEQSAIFQLVREINKTNAKNVTSIVFDHKENCPTTPGGHFNDDWEKNVTSRVFTSCFLLYKYKKTAPPPPGSHENALPTGGHVFSLIWTIFELVRDITIKPMKTAPPTGGHVFQQTRTTFELNQHIIKTNILTKLHEDWA